MSAFPKYPKYKDSGLEWLGVVPEHWEISRSRRVFTQRKELARKDDQQLSATQAYGVIPQADYEERIGRSVVKISMHLEKRKHVEPDDFVISMRSFQGGLERAWARGAIRSSYTVLEPALKVAPSYFAYLFKCPQYIGALQSTGNFIRDGQDLTYQNYILVDLPLPPFVEQERIGAFLDEKTAQIDALIAKKQRQIELLDEQKAILINRAVTRGIVNGGLGIVNEEAAEAASDHSTFTIQNSQFKDSGIPWIGPIPKHWRVVPIKRMASVQNGVTLGPVYPVNMSSEVPYLRVANVQNGSLNLNVVATLRLPRRVAAKYLLQSGDVLVAEGGDLDKLGRGCVWRAELPYCIHQNHVFAVRTEAKRLLPEFLSTALGSRYGQRYFMLTGKQTTNLASTNSTSLMNFPLATPPVEEQERIMEELARTQTAFERARSAITSQIHTLQTLRSTLIAHAVTGKIKV